MHLTALTKETYFINSSALIGGKFTLKIPLQDLLFSLNAVISTIVRIEFITGHVIFNGAYNEIFQLKTTIIDHIASSVSFVSFSNFGCIVDGRFNW